MWEAIITAAAAHAAAENEKANGVTHDRRAECYRQAGLDPTIALSAMVGAILILALFVATVIWVVT